MPARKPSAASAIYQLVVMGWSDSHLHHFIVGSALYGVPDPLEDGFVLGPPTKNERRVRLSDVLPGEKSRMINAYDFGDSWLLGRAGERGPSAPQVT